MNRCFYQSGGGGFGSWVGVLHGGGFEVHSLPFWVSVSFLGFGAVPFSSVFSLHTTERARIDGANYTEEAGLKHTYTLETVDCDDTGGVCV